MTDPKTVPPSPEHSAGKKKRVRFNPNKATDGLRTAGALLLFAGVVEPLLRNSTDISIGAMIALTGAVVIYISAFEIPQ